MCRVFKGPWKELAIIWGFAFIVFVSFAVAFAVYPEMPRAPLSNHSISALGSMVGIIALIMAIMGVFLTLATIGVGNFRHDFITTLDMCNEKHVDMNKNAMMRRGLFTYRETILLDIARIRTEKIHENTKVLGLVIITATGFIILLFLLVIYIILSLFYCGVHIDDLGTSFGRVLFFNVHLLIVILTSIFIYVAKIVSYPDLAELHKALAEHIIGEITKDQKEVQQENTDSKNKQETPSENTGG